MPDTNKIIQLAHISKAFDEKVVLDDISLDIHANEITAVIGKSGVGKSVLVKNIVGLIQPDKGEIFFDGKPYSGMNQKDFSEIKSRCSYMFQNNALFDSLTVFENIALPLKERGKLSKKEIMAKVSDKIEQLDLQEAANKYPKQLSGGMQKRVALARALSTDPEIIFFDEPTTGLDPIRKNAVFSMIHMYHERFNFTAVIITHDVPDIFHIAHRVHILEEGKIIFSGTPVELEQSEDQRLFVYTHGQELLLDELAGLHHRLQLVEEMNALMARQTPFSLVTLRFRNLRTLIDYKGNVVAQKLLMYFIKILHKELDTETFKAKYSQNVIACLILAEGEAHIDLLRRKLTLVLKDTRMKKLFSQNLLTLELGGMTVEEPAYSNDLISLSLQTATPLN